MGTITKPKPVLLLIAASSRYEAALAWGQECAEQTYGAVVSSPAFDFTETDYYQQEMGTELKKQFWVARQPIDPEGLAEIKRTTNAWEAEYNTQGLHPEPRPLNLDPGYLTMAKLVLASTKDHAHRVYLRQGIYAEVTLQYRSGGWQKLPWTYPDYQRADFQAFFTDCRQLLKVSSC